MLARLRRRARVHARRHHRRSRLWRAIVRVGVVLDRGSWAAVASPVCSSLQVRVAGPRRRVGRHHAGPSSRSSGSASDDFLEVETSEEGLGPAFNGTRAAPCATACPRSAATARIAEVRAGKRRPRSANSMPLDPSGETLFHLFSVPGTPASQSIPADATIIVRRVPIPRVRRRARRSDPDERAAGPRGSQRSQP